MEGLKLQMKNFSEDFVDKYSQSDICVNELCYEFKNNLKTLVDQCIPSKMVSGQKRAPWISNKIKRYHRRKQRAYNKARKTGSEDDWNSFRNLRKETHNLTRNAHRSYVRDFCLESKKQFWSFVSNLKKDTSGIHALKDQGILYSDNKKKAELLNSQFRSVFTKENMSSIYMPNFVSQNLPSISNINVSVDGVEKLLFFKPQ